MAPVSEAAVRAALAAVDDPELPVSVVDLGLVRGVAVDGDVVRVAMTYTSIACPCTDLIREDVRAAVAALEGVREVVVEDCFEPWTRADMTDEARTTLRALAIV